MKKINRMGVLTALTGCLMLSPAFAAATLVLHYEFEDDTNPWYNSASGYENQDTFDVSTGITSTSGFAGSGISLRTNSTARTAIGSSTVPALVGLNLDNISVSIYVLSAEAAPMTPSGRMLALRVAGDDLQAIAGGGAGTSPNTAEYYRAGIYSSAHRDDPGKVNGTGLGPYELGYDQWHQVGFTSDGTTIKLYFDGELVRTFNTSGSSAGKLEGLITDFAIGSGWNLNGDRANNNNITLDEVRIYNGVLSDNEMQDIFTTTIPEPSVWGLGIIAALPLVLRRRR